ncbi:MAG: hypothetical protein CL908_06525, partial [Deltaproteobacteria bacterium]|nr:hypothetical protein [Deltaproteobacteria bacterium]
MTTRKTLFTRATAVALATGGVLGWQILNDSPSIAGPPDNPTVDLAPRTAREAAQARSAGAAWLVTNQNADGGWGAGGWGRGSATTQSDVATTALATMALLRDDPALATHARAFERGVAFVVKAIEESPEEGSLLRGPEGTQPQHKLGRNVDTHFASLLLGEVAGRVSPVLEERIMVAYDKVLTKVVSAQRADGSFDQDGWAPVLSSSIAAQGLYKALENG